MTKKHVKKSNKSQAQEKADNHIAMCVMVKSWILGDGHQPIGVNMVGWSYHVLFWKLIHVTNEDKPGRRLDGIIIIIPRYQQHQV